MHPFFKSVKGKEDRTLLEEREDVLDEPLKQLRARSDDQKGPNIDTSPAGLHNIPNSSGQQHDHDHADEPGERGYYFVDADVERRKRRKTTPSEESERATTQTTAQEATNDDGSWLAQLQAAADPTATGLHTTKATKTNRVLSVPSSLHGSPLKVAIRKSAIKTPAKSRQAADAPTNTPPSASRSDTRSSSTAAEDKPSPVSGSTPKKKVLKLTSKGKLLSSPPSANPASKGKVRSKTKKDVEIAACEPQRILRIEYGQDKESRTRIGSQIDSILSPKADTSSHFQGCTPRTTKATHPFFLGKPAKHAKSDVVAQVDESAVSNTSDADDRTENAVVKPKDWSDVSFKNRTFIAKVVDAVHPLWPPKGMQHMHGDTLPTSLQHNRQRSMIHRRSSKSRKEHIGLSDNEDILQRFAASLDHHRSQQRDPFPLPQKIVIDLQDVMNRSKDILATIPSSAPNTNALENAYPEAFERIQCKPLSRKFLSNTSVPGVCQSWLSNSAPVLTCQVLQSQSNDLHQWLASHQVHQTATKLSTEQKLKTVRKKRRKKRVEDLEEFIATSDEDEELSLTTKNAILITGPSGCGKTASVYAAAKELDFEVFEIHPGMRRSGKDIFDKVGHMTQNHLVHRSTQPHRISESTPDIAIVGSNGRDPHGSNNILQTLLRPRRPNEIKGRPSQPRPESTQDQLDQKSRSQKQSLILLEEVDILFEEDKGFWTGVIELIEQSKRPVVLTCNDPTSIPVQDLPLHAILEYEQVPIDVAVEYISWQALAENHMLQRDAIRSLYRIKQMDLRATISELNFWCQMAVGSEKAGLDWTIGPRAATKLVTSELDKPILFSKDTYTTGMGLVPRTLISPSTSNQGSLLHYVQDELGIPLQYWHEEEDKYEHDDIKAEQLPRFTTTQMLQQHGALPEARSDLDLLNKPLDACDYTECMHGAMSAEFAASTLSAFGPQTPLLSIAEIMPAYLKSKAAITEPFSHSLPTAFEPLTTEKPQFPPSSGRLAPSLETSSVALMADIAPYVRSVVRYDQRLEEQRDALAGTLQGNKIRKTRAARAALEGGSKASTREEKWFPKSTDYAAVLQSGGAWPMWLDDAGRSSLGETSGASKTRTESTIPSSAEDLVMKDDE